MTAVRISIRDLAPNLRFVGKADRQTIRDGRVNGQELQTIRRLNAHSVGMLAVRLSEAGVEANEVRTLNTAALLQAGTIYSRRDLATRFEIKDATINNGVFRPKGHNSIWLFITNQKTSDRTPYADRLDGDVLDFDGQTQGGTDKLLIDHVVLGLDVLLFYRERKAAYPSHGFRFEGRFRYVTHKGERPKHFTFSRVTDYLVYWRETTATHLATDTESLSFRGAVVDTVSLGSARIIHQA
jgi:hypothetical protein